MIENIDDLENLLTDQLYVTDRDLATVIYLSLKLKKPLFLEGEAGVGKTEVAKVLSKGMGRHLIRVQCYEGLDANTALYEWNYPKQLLRIKLKEMDACKADTWEDIFTEDYLIKRPLLQAIQHDDRKKQVVLLIDELDRSDAEFEAFLLELLSDFQVSIPELGTLRALDIPLVVITSNRTRELHDAIKRRCLYHWIDYPSIEKERKVLQLKIPGIEKRLADQICHFMGEVRSHEFLKRPGVAETLDWAHALLVLNQNHLDEETVRATQGCLFKYNEDRRLFNEIRGDLLQTALCGSM
ncbi:MAG: AAA family ATPase [Desulfobacterales bacterium]